MDYRYYLGTRMGDTWPCDVVKCSVEEAFVVSAYLTHIRKQGWVLWPPSP